MPISCFSQLDQCFDGTCVHSYHDCPQQQDCAALSRASGVSLITCWNGECLTPSACPPLPPCPQEYPVRCSDSQCVANPKNCSSLIIQECPLGTERCGTGDCLSDCPGVDGCNVNETECPTGDCVSLTQSDFTGESDYWERCPSLKEIEGK